MGTSFVGPGGAFRISDRHWHNVVRLALLFGWKPAAPKDDPRLVEPGDAARLADALERSLPDIPDHDVRGADGLLACFSGPAKQGMRDFVAFCRAGGFRLS